MVVVRAVVMRKVTLDSGYLVRYARSRTIVLKGVTFVRLYVTLVVVLMLMGRSTRARVAQTGAKSAIDAPAAVGVSQRRAEEIKIGLSYSWG